MASQVRTLAGYHHFQTGADGHVSADVAARRGIPDASVARLPGYLQALTNLAERGITVNCVNPGPNDTGHHDAAAWAWVAERNPGGRASTPQDTARLVGWLVSDEAGWVTGQVIASDGGWSTLGA